MLDDYRESQQFVIEHREYFERAGQAILAKINGNDRAAEALHEQATSASAITPHSDHNVSTANVSTANASTANASTANVSPANVSTANASTANVSTANVSTANVSEGNGSTA
jgi:uncharacterized protein YjbI with pentapeptide repeats